MLQSSSIIWRTKHVASRPLHAYANIRVGATRAEKQCHKLSDSILLTFDDYGSETQVNELLAILAAEGVKAMFFLQGDWVAEHPALLARIQKAGHVVGNHTYSHPVLKGLSAEKIAQEVTTGLPGPWLRPPEGRYDKRVRKLVKRLGFSICYWTIDSRDWTGASVEAMRHTILSELQPGAAILFHLHGAHTRALLPSLIADIRARGFALTNMDETWTPETR